ncbi:MAG: hypothetical protein ACLQIQ_07450 [Beijerinckiaceae bacterium]
MNNYEKPHAFVWTKIQAEPGGENVRRTLNRKELERLATNP